MSETYMVIVLVPTRTPFAYQRIETVILHHGDLPK